jgi:hypothetical protein
MKALISSTPAETAEKAARELAMKAGAAADQAKDAKLLARLAKRRLKEARRDFKRARKASKQARKEARAMKADALAAAKKAANLKRRENAFPLLAAAPKQPAAAQTKRAMKSRRSAMILVKAAGSDAAAPAQTEPLRKKTTRSANTLSEDPISKRPERRISTQAGAMVSSGRAAGVVTDAPLAPSAAPAAWMEPEAEPFE